MNQKLKEEERGTCSFAIVREAYLRNIIGFILIQYMIKIRAAVCWGLQTEEEEELRTCCGEFILFIQKLVSDYIIEQSSI